MVPLVKITIIIITFECVRFCELAEYNRFGLVEKREEVKACGSMLADLLSNVCSGKYNDQNIKRGDHKAENMIPDSDYYYSYEAYPENLGAYPFRTKRSISSILRSSRLKRKQGLVDECCKKACSMDELRLYCG